MKLVASRKPEKKKHQPHSTLPKEKYTFYLIKTIGLRKVHQGNMHHFLLVFILLVHQDIYYRQNYRYNISSEKFLSVIYKLSINLSVIIVSIDLQTDKTCQKNISTDINSSLEKFSFVIYGLSVNSSVINVPIDLQTDKACQKNICFISSVNII